MRRSSSSHIGYGSVISTAIRMSSARSYSGSETDHRHRSHARDFSFFGDEVDFLTPLEINKPQSQSKSGFIIVVGPLEDECSIKQAQAEIDTIAAQLESGDPERHKGNGAQLQSLAGSGLRRISQSAPALQGAVGFVLVDWLRKRRGSVTRASRFASNRSRGPHGAWRRPGANRPATGHREFSAFRAGRHIWVTCFPGAG